MSRLIAPKGDTMEVTMIMLSAFADEASASLTGQIEALRRCGLTLIEIRGINGKNVSEISEDEAREYKKQLDEGGIKVSAIGSPIGKTQLDGGLDEHLKLLVHICRLAKIFECDRVRIFSFYGAYGREAEVFSALSKMVEIASEYGITLCHENEKEIYGDTAERVMKLMDNVDGMHYVYDPANFIECGESPDVTLPSLFERITYFHIKDARISTRKVVPAGFGDGRIGDLVSMIKRDTVLSVEPHLMVFDGYSKLDRGAMQDEFVFSSNDEAFDAAIGAIKKILFREGYTERDGAFIKKQSEDNGGL